MEAVCPNNADEKMSTQRPGSLRVGMRGLYQRDWNLRLSAPVIEERPQPVAAAGMAQLAQSFGFDLPDALAGDGKVLTHFFERVLAAVVEAKAHFDDLLFARSERL